MKRRLHTVLDSRYKGYPQWKYCVARPERTSVFYSTKTKYESMQVFFKWRRWCWETWGASKELVEWLDDLTPRQTDVEDHNEHWCWVNDQYSTRIYLRDDADLSLFLLRWA